MALSREDYEEAACPLCRKPEKEPIPVRRILEKLDGYLGKDDPESAEKLLENWIREAEDGGDLTGKLTMVNEQIGLYRKLDREEECLSAAAAALDLVKELHLEDSVTGGTTYVNVATGYKAFGRADLAVPFYRRALKVYEERLEPGDTRMAALNNNMALALTEQKEYEEARIRFEKALSLLCEREHGEAEAAITCLNLADLVAAEVGAEEGAARIEAYLERAEQLLDTPDLPQNGYYAFVCEKCAPAFGYYGFFLTEQKFAERARAIYERS